MSFHIWPILEYFIAFLHIFFLQHVPSRFLPASNWRISSSVEADKAKIFSSRPEKLPTVSTNQKPAFLAEQDVRSYWSRNMGISAKPFMIGDGLTVPLHKYYRNSAAWICPDWNLFNLNNFERKIPDMASDMFLRCESICENNMSASKNNNSSKSIVSPTICYPYLNNIPLTSKAKQFPNVLFWRKIMKHPRPSNWNFHTVGTKP